MFVRGSLCHTMAEKWRGNRWVQKSSRGGGSGLIVTHSHQNCHMSWENHINSFSGSVPNHLPQTPNNKATFSSKHCQLSCYHGRSQSFRTGGPSYSDAAGEPCPGAQVSQLSSVLLKMLMSSPQPRLSSLLRETVCKGTEYLGFWYPQIHIFKSRKLHGEKEKCCKISVIKKSWFFPQ